MKRALKNVLLIWVIFFSQFILAQPLQKNVIIRIAPDHSDWKYHTGENALFCVEVLRSNVSILNVKVAYECGKETQTPSKIDTIIIKNGLLKINGGTLNEPGFLRCKVSAEVDGYKYEELCTVAFDAEKIKPTVKMPEDFQQFWGKTIKENASIPLEPKMELIPGLCTDKVDVYHVSFQSFRIGSRIYGWLAIPKKTGKYPAILRVPGAGVWKNGPDINNAEKGVIVLSIGIHGIPLTMDNSIYEILRTSALWCYWLYGIDDVDNYYYKRVYMGCMSANNFLFQLPEFDGENLGVFGDSQGGALATVTAALDKRVKAYAAYYPALCDLCGYLNGRAGGWPHVFKGVDPQSPRTKTRMKVVEYYDVVNFAKLINVPCYYTWGYNDVTCPPTSFYSAFNVIKSLKQCYVVPETGHWTYPEQSYRLQNWLVNQLKN